MKSFVLSSGSSANCFYLENNERTNKILIDCGLSFSKTKLFLKEKGIDIFEIDYIFITHEHVDHINGFELMFKNLNCKFYLSRGTFDFLNSKYIKLNLNSFKDRFIFVKNYDIIKFNDLNVFVVDKPHDANEPISFIFEENEKKFGFFTDLGCIDRNLFNLINGLDILFIEANYCEEILNIKKNDFYLNYVMRLTSDLGHLSVNQCCNFLNKIVKKDMKIVLCHISENTNSYENTYLKVKSLFNGFEFKPEIIVSFQNEPTDWIN